MKRTTTEKYDGKGRLIERMVVEEEEVPANVVLPYIPYLPSPYVQMGGCSACSQSGICNCILGSGQITCTVAGTTTALNAAA